ncbi:MAG: hypothetical protein V3T81_09545, partial [Thermoanaerobaculia bacterium]
MHEHGARQRQTTVLGYYREEVVDIVPFSVPVSAHPIDSINLRDRRIGLFEWLGELVHRYEISKGRVDLVQLLNETMDA